MLQEMYENGHLTVKTDMPCFNNMACLCLLLIDWYSYLSRFKAGLTSPRWQVVQFTIGVSLSRLFIAPSNSWLILPTIAIISRAICFCDFSSLLQSLGLWQWVQDTPNDLLNPISITRNNLSADARSKDLIFSNTRPAASFSFPADLQSLFLIKCQGIGVLEIRYSDINPTVSYFYGIRINLPE